MPYTSPFEKLYKTKIAPNLQAAGTILRDNYNAMQDRVSANKRQIWGTPAQAAPAPMQPAPTQSAPVATSVAPVASVRPVLRTAARPAPGVAAPAAKTEAAPGFGGEPESAKSVVPIAFSNNQPVAPDNTPAPDSSGASENQSFAERYATDPYLQNYYNPDGTRKDEAVNRPILGGSAEVAQPRSAEDIRREELQRAQAMIDATEGLFQEQLADIRQRGKEAMNQTSSIAVGAGLAGSPFQQAQETKTQEYTNREEKAARSERAAQIAAVMAAAEGRATDAYDKEQARYRQDREFAVQERDKSIVDSREQAEQVRTRAAGAVKNLATSGIALSELSPEQRQKLLTDANMTEFEANAIWAANSPQAGGKTEVVNGNVMTYYMNPKTGKPVISVTALPEALRDVPEANMKEVVTEEGVFVYDAKNPTPTLHRVGAAPAKASDLKAPEVKTFNDQAYQWNAATGNWDKIETSQIPDSSKLQKAQDVLTLAQDVLGDPALNAAVGPISTRLPTVRGSSADFEAKVTRLKSLLTLENLGILKGAISDRDMEVLTSAATSLDTKMSESGFRSEVQRIIERVSPILNGATTGSNADADYLRQRGFTEEEIKATLGFNSAPSKAQNGSAQAIAAAIKKVESGGNYNARGGSGEFGAYQFMPSTWKGWAKTYLGNANAAMTPANQDKVAEARIQDLLNQGRTPEQIALIWNGGQPIVKKGVNQYGVAYDSGAYAKKVLNALS